MVPSRRSMKPEIEKNTKILRHKTVNEIDSEQLKQNW